MINIDDLANSLHSTAKEKGFWDDNNGKPGNLIYQDDSFSPRNPKYSDRLGGFVTYFFKDTMKIALPKTFYIGWRQVSSTGLNIGYDLGVLTPEIFAMMVIMALVTTFMTGPALDLINWIF